MGETTTNAPTIDWAAKLPRIMEDFVDQWRGTALPKYDTRAPWLADDGYIYATDGRAIVRIPGSSVDPEIAAALRPGDRFVPPDVWSRCLEHAGPFTDETPVTLPVAGQGWSDCPRCDGYGTWQCDCPNCDDDHECEVCDEEGQVENRTSVRVGQADIAAHFVAKLRRHGVRTVQVGGLQDKDGWLARSIRFRIGYVEGLVMGMATAAGSLADDDEDDQPSSPAATAGDPAGSGGGGA